MRRIREILFRGVLFSLIPALCNFLGSTNVLNKAQEVGYIGISVDVELVKFIFFLASIVLTFGLLTYNLIVAELNERKYKSRAKALVKYTKEIMTVTLGSILEDERLIMSFKIFIPQKTLMWRIKNFVGAQNNKLYFCMKDVIGFDESTTKEKIRFIVSPKEESQGLIGDCYNERKMIYDDNLVENNSTVYNLSEYQINKTNDLRFVFVCPVFDTNANIEAIVSFHSKNDVKIDNSKVQEISNVILNYTQQLHERVPGLFKKGGLL